jgi:hypothetical protein
MVMGDSFNSALFKQTYQRVFSKVREQSTSQGCGSGFSDFVDPDPYWWESGSRIQGQEKNIKKFQWKMHF